MSSAEIIINYVGDLDVASVGADIVVKDDHEYLEACRALENLISVDEGGAVWAATRHHALWLADFLRQTGAPFIYREQTPRTILADAWGVKVPEWLSDDDIREEGLLSLQTDTLGLGSFEQILAAQFFGGSFTDSSPDPKKLPSVISALTDEKTVSVFSRYTLVKRCVRSICDEWASAASEAWLKKVYEVIADKPIVAAQWCTAKALLHGYPEELLQRVIPVQDLPVVKVLPVEIAAKVRLDSLIKEESLTQIDLYLTQAFGSITETRQFLRVINMMSGLLAEEFRHVHSFLSRRRIELNSDDIKAVIEKFQACPGVRRSRLESLKFFIRPSSPSLIGQGEKKDPDEWIRWTVKEYVPYRDWQVHNGVFDEELESTVTEFSNWYIMEYETLQNNSRYSLPLCLDMLKEERLHGLTILLLIDCLPVSFFHLFEESLRSKGFFRHELSYRFSSLPTLTEYNKAALFAGRSGHAGGSYEEILRQRTRNEWGVIDVLYARNLKELSEIDVSGDSTMVVLNYLPGDEVLHSNLESKNRTPEEELSREYGHLAETVSELCDRWPGSKQNISLLLTTDHGACRILEEESESFDSSIVRKLFDNEKHRCARMTEDQAEKIPVNLWDLGYRFKQVFGEDDFVHYLPKGHNTVSRVGRNSGYMHGGVTPEEVIVPFAVYRPSEVSWQTPRIRYPDLKVDKNGTVSFYIQRTFPVKMEVQNLNASPVYITGIEIQAPEADIKSVNLAEVYASSTAEIRIDLYLQKEALQSKALELRIAYTIGGEEKSIDLIIPAEFKSAMSGGFNLKDLKGG